MSPEESTAIATWIGVAVAGAFGITGFIIGLVGLHHAGKAKEAAAGANLIAKDANALSKKANSISEESNEIAREANDISRKLADRSDEQHDVAWEWEFAESPREGSVRVQNIGKDVAHDATIQFMFEKVTEATPAPEDVDGRGLVYLEIPGLLAAIESERRELARREHESKENPLLGIVVPHSPRQVDTRLRVKWRSESGAPLRHDTGWESSYLPD